MRQSNKLIPGKSVLIAYYAVYAIGLTEEDMGKPQVGRIMFRGSIHLAYTDWYIPHVVGRRVECVV